MENSHIEVKPDGRVSAYVGPDATRLFAVISLRGAIKMYSAVKIIPTRGMTIGRLLDACHQYTGVKYTKNQAGYHAAIHDLTVWIEDMKCALPVEVRP